MASGFRQTYTFSIASGTAVSGTVDLGAAPEFTGTSSSVTAFLFTPGGWDTAALGVELSQDGVTWANAVSTNGAETAVATALTASTVLVTSGGVFTGTRYVRFHSGTLAVPVNQTATRNFTFVLSRAAA